MLITNSTFLYGIAQYGGAIYISGESDTKLVNCRVLDNYAAIFGGAIFANGFRSLSVMAGSKFSDNLASQSGDDFYLSNTVTTFLL